MPDRSLDDFTDGTDDASDATDRGDADGDDAVGGDAGAGPDDADARGGGDCQADEATDDEAGDADDPPAVAPPTPTLRFDPDGAACADCGATVRRRWSDADGRPVCEACKSWDA